MLEPLRERIKAAIVAQLQTIRAGSVAYGNQQAPITVDYWYTPQLITRTLLSPDQYKAELAQGYVVGVLRSLDSTLERLGSLGPFEHQLAIDLVAYARGDAVAAADTKLERIWDDQRRALLVDDTLGGLVANLRPSGQMETDRGLWEPEGFFRQPWLARALEPVPS